MANQLRTPASGNSRAENRLDVQDLNDGIKEQPRLAMTFHNYPAANLLERVAMERRGLRTRVRHMVICTHAKFSTIELCRVLMSLGIQVTFYPVDYSREEKNIERLQSLGVTVVSEPDAIVAAITLADCAIEDGARLSKIIDARGVKVRPEFFAVEQTSGGVRYFKEHAPRYPVINVAMSPIKLDIENRRATPERIIQHFSEVTGKLIAGKQVLVLGFGAIGEGLARLATAHGAHVTVYDILATKRLFAKHQGYATVEPHRLDHALGRPDVIFMATNSYQGTLLSIERLLLLKDGAIICNAGSGRGELGVEVQTPGTFVFHGAQVTVTEPGRHLHVHMQKGDLQKSVTVLGKGFPLNLHLGKGTSHDAIQLVMAMMLLAAIQGPAGAKPGLQDLSSDIQEYIAQLVLKGEAEKTIRPRYVQSRTLAVSERPYGGVFPFHNELSRDANVSVVRAWFKHGSKTRGHYHRRSQEAYYAERGAADVIVWPAGQAKKEAYALQPGDYLLVPEGYFHDVVVTSAEDFECLVIATPPFQLWDQFFNLADETHA